MHPSLSIIIAAIVWALAMARMLPRAWRLDKNVQRRHRDSRGPSGALDRTYPGLSPQKALN